MRNVDKEFLCASYWFSIKLTYCLCSFFCGIQIDSFAAARDNEMHEATRRILSVLLRQFNLVGYCLRYTEWHVIYLLSIEIDCVLEF